MAASNFAPFRNSTDTNTGAPEVTTLWTLRPQTNCWLVTQPLPNLETISDQTTLEVDQSNDAATLPLFLTPLYFDSAETRPYLAAVYPGVSVTLAWYNTSRVTDVVI